MTTTTLNYVLAVTIQRRDEIARWIKYHENEDDWTRSLAEANSAVRELLEIATGQPAAASAREQFVQLVEHQRAQAATAAEIGRKGGSARVRKGLAMHTTEQRKASAVKAWATRRAKATAAAPTP